MVMRWLAVGTRPARAVCAHSLTCVRALSDTAPTSHAFAQARYKKEKREMIVGYRRELEEKAAERQAIRAEQSRQDEEIRKANNVLRNKYRDMRARRIMELRTARADLALLKEERSRRNRDRTAVWQGALRSRQLGYLLHQSHLAVTTENQVDTLSLLLKEYDDVSKVDTNQLLLSAAIAQKKDRSRFGLKDEVYVMNRIAKVGGDNGDGGAINEAELENDDEEAVDKADLEDDNVELRGDHEDEAKTRVGLLFGDVDEAEPPSMTRK